MLVKNVHELPGAIAVGARPFLIAFNVNLLVTTLQSRVRSHALSERGRWLALRESVGF